MIANLQSNSIEGKQRRGTIDGKTCSNQINLLFSIENVF